MTAARHLAAAFICIAGVGNALAADPVQWAVADGGNGHHYLFVPDAVSWQDALAAAAATSWLGLPGYLATATSAAENEFLSSTAAGGTLAWLGGSDDGSEGSWTWRAGPENGQALTYFNWLPAEPNNCCGGENYLQTNWESLAGWNDHGGPGNAGQLNGYVIEYGSVVPEPATAPLTLLGVATLLTALRRRQRR